MSQIDVFVSYSSIDLQRIKPFVAALEAENLSVWWDRELVAGETFDEEIESALANANCIVAVWSEESIKSRWVRAEANEGLERGILVPVLIDPVKPPLVFRTAHTANLVGWPAETGELSKIVQTIKGFRHESTDRAATNFNSQTTKPSVAVLPFKNLSQDADNEFFSDGITEEILNGLARSSELVVKARTSSFQFKNKDVDVREISQKLGVAYLVEGSVRMHANQVRVTAQLIKCEPGNLLWSENYTKKMEDVFAVQDEIAASILAALNLHFPKQESASTYVQNVDAYSLYLKGKHYRNLQQFDQAIHSLEAAIKLEPNFVQPYLELIRAHQLLVMYQLEASDVAAKHIDDLTIKAKELDSDQPMLLHGDANIQFYTHRNFQRALNEYEVLCRRFPNEMLIVGDYALALRIIGRMDLAIACQEQVLELDPINPLAHSIMGFYYLNAGQYGKAREKLELAESLGIKSPMQLSLIAALENDTTMLDMQLSRDVSNWTIPGTLRLYQAVKKKIQGEEEDAKEIINSEPFASPLMCGAAAALVGDVEGAVQHYRDALLTRDRFAYMEVNGPYLRGITSNVYRHQKFQSMLAEFSLDNSSLEALQVSQLPYSFKLADREVEEVL